MTTLRGPETISATVPGFTAAQSLGREAARGALAMMLGQIGRLTIQLAGVVVLARVLSPEDYGAFAMVTVVVSHTHRS